MSSESRRTLSTFNGRSFEDALIAYNNLYSSDEETEPASLERFADVGKETIESMKVTAEKDRIDSKKASKQLKFTIGPARM